MQKQTFCSTSFYSSVINGRFPAPTHRVDRKGRRRHVRSGVRGEAVLKFDGIAKSLVPALLPLFVVLSYKYIQLKDKE